MRKFIILLSGLMLACRGPMNIPLKEGARYVNNSGGSEWVVLPDNSRVKIGDGTTIAVGAGFTHGNRAVDLDGEGMFLVRASGEEGLTVTTKDLFIRGPGTKFTVEAARNEPGEEVDLLDGSLVIRKIYHSDLDSAPASLHSGDLLMINREIDLMEVERMTPEDIRKAGAKFGSGN